MNIALISPMAISLKLFRKDLILDLVSQGHTVYCFATDFSKEDKQLFSDWGVATVDYHLNARGVNPVKDAFATWELSKELKKLSLDVVFSFFVKPVIFGTIAARLAKVPRVVGMIEGLGNAFTMYPEGQSKKQLFVKKIQVFLYKLSLPKLDSLIFLNSDDKKDLIDSYNIQTKEMNVLGGIGLNLLEFEYQSANTKHISFIFVARLLREKGVFEYLQAAEKIKEIHPRVTFYILGGIDKENPFALKRNELESYLHKGIVSYPGHVENVPTWIAKSSVFVLPSFYREGVPRSTQEAMAIGRPVITTNSVGCKETVDDGINGFLVPPFSPDALVEKMLFFIDNPEMINKMGRESRNIAEKKFDVKKINQRLIKIILGA